MQRARAIRHLERSICCDHAGGAAPIDLTWALRQAFLRGREAPLTSPAEIDQHRIAVDVVVAVARRTFVVESAGCNRRLGMRVDRRGLVAAIGEHQAENERQDVESGAPFAVRSPGWALCAPIPFLRILRFLFLSRTQCVTLCWLLAGRDRWLDATRALL
jgi:hypothetical protein